MENSYVLHHVTPGNGVDISEGILRLVPLTLLYVKESKSIKMYVYARRGCERLILQYFHVRPISLSDFDSLNLTSSRYCIVTKRRDYIHSLNIDIEEILHRLPEDTILALSISKLSEKRRRRIEKYVRDLSRRIEQSDYVVRMRIRESVKRGSDLLLPKPVDDLTRRKISLEIEKLLSEELYSIKLILFTELKDVAKNTAKLLRQLTGLDYAVLSLEKINIVSLLFPEYEEYTVITTGSIIRQLVKVPKLCKTVPIYPEIELPSYESPSSGVLIGHAIDGSPIRVELSDLYRHVYVLGSTGSGKSTFLLNLTVRLCEKYRNKVTIVVIDPHGDLADNIAMSVPYDNYVLIDFTRMNVSYNPLELPRYESWGEREIYIRHMLNNLIRIFEDILRFEPDRAPYVVHILQTVLGLLYAKTDAPTFVELYENVARLLSGEYSIGEYGSDPILKMNVESLRKIPSRSALSALTRLARFVSDPLLRSVFSGSTSIDFERLLEEGYVLIFKIDPSQVSEDVRHLLLATLLIRLWFEWRRIIIKLKRKYGEDWHNYARHLFLVIDEAQHVLDLPITSELLTEARKFHFHLVLAHQSPEQISEEAFEIAFTNTGLKILFNMSGKSSSYIARHVHPRYSQAIENILPQLPQGQAIAILPAKVGELPYPPIHVYCPPPPARRRSLRELYEHSISLLEKYRRVRAITALPFTPLEWRILAYVYDNEVRLRSLHEVSKKLNLAEDAVRDIVRGLIERKFLTISSEDRLVLTHEALRFIDPTRVVDSSRLGGPIHRSLIAQVLHDLRRRGYAYIIDIGSERGEAPDIVAYAITDGSYIPIAIIEVVSDIVRASCEYVKSLVEKVEKYGINTLIIVVPRQFLDKAREKVEKCITNTRINIIVAGYDIETSTEIEVEYGNKRIKITLPSDKALEVKILQDNGHVLTIRKLVT
ncbi:MAG: DUF87 domain-containing protein, partial [Crenarchaeota archaeon]|nr:DUF87 domain-containing protein [Thermoproteota archaeon]